MMSRGFPNLFVMPAPGQQAVVTVNYTQLAVLGAEFVGRAVGLLEEGGAEVFDVSAEAEEAWTQKIVDCFIDGSGVMSACTPSRINNEGHPEGMNPRNGNYGRGDGRLVRISRRPGKWLEDGQLRWPGARGPVDGVVSKRQRVAVVTGGGGGIGAGIAEELGRQRLVRHHAGPAGHSRRLRTAARAGGDDCGSHRGCRRFGPGFFRIGNRRGSGRDFREMVEEHGALDAVVNVAGITRQTYFARGTEEDWLAVLDVHLGGYLNILEAALPLMADAGHGRVLGVTSGSGWRAADAGGVQLRQASRGSSHLAARRQPPPGVTVNAMSPIAATRMVAAALERAREAGTGRGRRRAVASTRCPGPEELGPLGAYLVDTTSDGALARWYSPEVRRWRSSSGPG